MTRSLDCISQPILGVAYVKSAHHLLFKVFYYTSYLPNCTLSMITSNSILFTSSHYCGKVTNLIVAMQNALATLKTMWSSSQFIVKQPILLDYHGFVICFDLKVLNSFSWTINDGSRYNGYRSLWHIRIA